MTKNKRTAHQRSHQLMCFSLALQVRFGCLVECFHLVRRQNSVAKKLSPQEHPMQPPNMCLTNKKVARWEAKQWRVVPNKGDVYSATSC